MMDWGYMGAGSGAMLLIWVFGLLLLVGVLILVTSSLVQRDRTRPTPPEHHGRRSAAESELELRFARGEIDAATFVEARSLLRQHVTG